MDKNQEEILKGLNEPLEDCLTEDEVDRIWAETAYKEYVESRCESFPVEEFWKELEMDQRGQGASRARRRRATLAGTDAFSNQK